MSTPTCVLLADDFTGACDTGLQFVLAGLSARVQLAGEPAEGADVLVWDTGTRNCSAPAARDLVGRAARGLAPHSGSVWYKKVDSTLRGPIGAELEVLMQRTGRSLCVLAPALPGAGRTTRDGVHLVGGVPVHQTEAGRDPEAPVAHSSIADLLASTAAVPTASVPLAQVRAGADALWAGLARLDLPAVAIVDAEEPRDLETIAKAAARLDRPPLLCGCAGLAAFVPAAFDLHSRTPPPPAGAPCGRLLLVVAGSARSHTRHQLDHLRQHLKAREIPVSAAADPERVAAEATAGSAAGAVVSILSLRLDEPEPDAALRVMARAARCISREPGLSGVAVTGGTTAVALLAELSASAVDVLEPVGAQVPLCRLVDGPFAGLHLVTKGGGLGEEDVFVRAARRLVPNLS